MQEAVIFFIGFVRFWIWFSGLSMGPLQLVVTWQKQRHTGEQIAHWDF